MKRGTTPTHTFTLPFDVSLVAKARILYSQNGAPVLTKEGSDITMVDNTLSVKLSQEETFKFDYNKYVEIQVRVLTQTGEVLASNIVPVSVGQCLEEEVLV